MRRVPERGRWATALALVLVCAAGPAAADIISLTGNLILGVSTGNVAQVTANGLGIGTAIPSANLHVAGNAVVSGALAVGGTTNASGSNLHIGGTWGFSVQTVSSNTTLSGNSIVLVDTSSGNLSLRLPSPSSVPGRTYGIKKTTGLNTVTVHGSIDDNEILALASSANGYPYLNLVSTGNTWGVTGLSDGVTAGGIIASSNLVGWWRMNETSGNTTVDSSGQGVLGVLTNMDNADWVAGTTGNALDFDGTNDHVKMASGPALSTVFSMTLWFKPANLSTSNRYLLSKLVNAGNDNVYAILWEYVNDAVEFYAGSYTGANPRTGSQMTVSSTAWHHVAYCYDGTTWTGYLDGSVVFSVAQTFSLNASTNNLYLATFNGSACMFSGYLDDVRIYNKGLSAAEVQAIYLLAP